MKKILFVLVVSLLQLSCSKENPSVQLGEAVVVKASKDCFHGWVSKKGNTDPTGECKENGSGTNINSSIEVDYPTQIIYIHGSVSDEKGDHFTWLSRFKVTSCKDTEDGWTMISAENDRDTYDLKYRPLKSIPPVGKAKESFEGEAELSVEIDGQTYHADMTCTRNVF